ncbi:MAG: hypothetical protein U5L09_05135 [Bacteroidales bacterium]|nr:hypothetical protein [Bacteroidales bacterium]
MAAVFGRVYETYYDDINNEVLSLFWGARTRRTISPVSGHRTGSAEKCASHSPRYYIGRDFIVSGLVTQWNGNPEIVINYSSQLKRY